MRLLSLRIRRLPGIDPGFELADVAPGINVVIGPNASGKSSVLRAVRALLYADELKHAPVDIDGVFEDAAGELRVTRVGAVQAWTRSGAAVAAPDLPPRHLLDCYTLGVEDLAALSGTDAAIARQLGLELLGGYDLAAVRDSGAFKPPGTGRSEAERLRRAEEHLRAVLRDNEELRQQQARIAGWRQELEEAGRADEDAAQHRRALELLGVRREILSLRQRLTGFPAGMERLLGNEVERLEALQARHEEEDGRLREARARRQDAERALADTGLEGRPLGTGDLNEWRSVVQELHRLEGDADGLATAVARAQAQLRQAEAELQASPPGHAATEGPDGGVAAPAAQAGVAPRLDPATLRRVDDALARKREGDARRLALQRELDLLPDPDGAERRPDKDVDALRDGRRALVAALAAGSRRWTALRVLGLLLALAGAAGALALAALAGRAWPLLAAAGALVAAGIPLLLRDGSGAARREAIARYRASTLPEPDGWDEATLREQLARLEEAVTDATAHAAALARREEVTRRLAHVERDLAAAVAELAEVAERVGFDPRHLDAGLQRWLRLVDAVDRARGDLAEGGAELARKREAVESRRGSLARFLRDHGEAPGAPDAGATVLGRRLEALAGRLADRDAAVAALQGAGAGIERAESERARLAEEIRALFAGAGLEPAPAEGAAADAAKASELALRERSDRLPAFKEARERLRGAEARHEDRARELAGRRDLLALVEADDEAALGDTLGTLQARAAQRDRLNRDITATETLIAEAERERALEKARAERQRAADALADLVGLTLRAEAGRFLLDRVAAEHEERSQPPALRRAAGWFRRFTRNRFELDYDSSRDPAFAAVETASGERRFPAELSTGTRAQLLLAVRVAFALEAEAGRASLPLFLDEALTTADAERFREVADSLSTLARDGARQLFYLTARGEDAALWRARSRAAGAPPDGDRPGYGEVAPHIIDIARIRDRSAAVAVPETLAVDPPVPVPAPDGAPPERYGALLGVPPLDPWRAAAACHVFHVLRDALPLVQRLVEAGAERVGPLRSLLRGPASDALLADGERRLLERRVRGLDAYLDGWRRGRGRPVERAALEASGAVSGTFLDRVDALARELGGDGKALVDALDGPRKVRNFHTAKRRELEAWLTEHGFIDPRPPATTAELRQRVFAALVGNGSASDGAGDGAGGGSLGEAERLTAWLEAAVRAGAPGGVPGEASDGPD